MLVACPVCSHLTQEGAYCEHCHAELVRQNVRELPRTNPVRDEALPPDAAATLYHAENWIYVTDGQKTWRAHFLGRSHEVENWQKNRPIAACLPPCEIRQTEEGNWVLAEADPKASFPWDKTPFEDPLAELERVLAYARLLAEALEELHQLGLVCATFSPRSLEFHGDGVRFANLDVRVFREGIDPAGAALKSSFAAPEICRGPAEAIGPATDVFHLALFVYYWLARLLPDGFAGNGLEVFGFRLPSLRIYAPMVALRVPRILAKGLSPSPAHRYATPTALCDALDEAARAMRERLAHRDGRLHWEIGAYTRTGRAKTFLGRDNEDHVLVRDFDSPPRALLAVADGITLCNVGSGALASLILSIVLENAFDEKLSEADFEDKVRDVCRRGSQTLLDWALAKGYRDQLAQGMDLMGSTLTVGWLEGNELRLGNLGDSRAYLIDDSGVEQLTVDGDLATSMLQNGTPPEDILELGSMAQALSKCVGGCVLTSDGEVAIVEESCRPSLSHWPLIPGDVLILCSDGLVEEGAFLEPRVLEETARAHPELESRQLAERLVDFADALQRLPSPIEPEGFGDNISCIVVKITADDLPR